MQATSPYYRAIISVIVVVVCAFLWAGAWPEGHATTPLSTSTSHPQPVSQGDTALSEFEGRYKVGPTTCTVKPIRMAFEVRWAKGRGAMRFFFEATDPRGKPTFVSEDHGRGTDRFVFEDNRYNVGTFVRADGKTFPVERVR